ncbi:response regulator transcription factor [Shewanella ulleungensis]|uniref:DNA-binding response regulator n=1 Tax=Shewanella ulleungensis TaxID=2282699 RepID=A0ABQ2QDR7_9GAMM|nr:response regulator [Shewanella ulleungensis]MCL1148850.1 response regulator [Shewanella ulleungensis]GGP75221.1 DNA-binding response regulator [Shewanella ulleungensis]
MSIYNNSHNEKALINGLVFIVDDEESVRKSLHNLLSSVGYQVQEFATAQAFLDTDLPKTPVCLILDMQMPDASGLDVAEKLSQNNITIPVIFLTGYGSIPLSVEAMKLGAQEFLTKPVNPDALLIAVDKALKWDRNNIQQRIEIADFTSRYQSLTPREKNVLEFIISGLLIKQIASELHVSEITIKVHKQKIMQKMFTKSLPELVRISERLNIISARTR